MTTKKEDVEALVGKAVDKGEKALKDVKTAAEKTKTRKAPAKNRLPKETAIIVELEDAQYDTEEIAKRAAEAYRETHKEAVKSLAVYIKPAEKVAYYVVNGEGSDEYRINI